MKYTQQAYLICNSKNTYRALHSRVFLVLLFSGLLLLSFYSNHAYSASKIVKWKDDKGVTHYGDSIPAQYANTETSEISQQGVTVKLNKPINAQEKAADAAKLEQDKKDKVLLSAFSSADEIDLARDRNLQPDIVAVENLEQMKKNNLKKLAENQAFANKFIKNKKPVPSDLSADIKDNQAEITKNERQINEHKMAMENTRKRFDEDKLRFQFLNESRTKPLAQ